MNGLVRKMMWPGGSSETEPLLSREWLVTNGLGGYASRDQSVRLGVSEGLPLGLVWACTARYGFQ